MPEGFIAYVHLSSCFSPAFGIPASIISSFLIDKERCTTETEKMDPDILSTLIRYVILSESSRKAEEYDVSGRFVFYKPANSGSGLFVLKSFS